jgi:U3 small nucleolar ribonucleoprotein protein IMP4
VPKADTQRVVTFANDNDFISFRHHFYEKSGKKVELKEIGPRFEMKLYLIRLGTLDQPEADVEWSLKPYMRTSRTRQAL